ncbi:MAG: zinc ribbon domain-containing protein, partial [Caldilinea sp.]
MAQKELGYVELEWICPVCKTRNPGTQATCSGCGAAQPETVHFETPAAAAIVEEQAKVERAKAGPDIHCAFCGARNPSIAKTCHQCGADLTEGKARETGAVVGAFKADDGATLRCSSCGMENPASARQCTRCGAPLGKQPVAPAAAPVPVPAGGMGRGALVFIVIAAIVVLGLGWLVFSMFQTSDTVGTAVDARWERSIAIMGQVPVRANAWQDQVPNDVANLSCSPRVRSTSDSPQPGAQEVCGTPYTVDTGTGMGRVVQECVYEVYDDYCSYTTLQWGVVNTVVQRGSGLSAAWPSANLTTGQELGQRSERYECVVTANDREYSFPLRNTAELEQCQPDSRWRLSVNSLGSVLTLKRQRLPGWHCSSSAVLRRG